MTPVSEEPLQLDALALTDHLRRRVVDFTLDEAYLRDEHLREISQDIWSGPAKEGGLISDLWIEGAFPSQPSLSDTLASLVREGLFDRSLCHQLKDAIPPDRLLFTHQVEALRVARRETADDQRPAIVITAPTGGGKTEAFLLPALDLLKRQPRRGPGMRCLILYPMNALVVDQTNRLERWLTGQSTLRMFHFTSETPEDAHAARTMNIPVGPPCRVRTRQEARGFEDHDGKRIEQPSGTVPEVVITNYSMLEYMLSRPQDAAFFGQGLDVIILDEAHLYRGTLAAEIALLLRRLLLRCERSSDQVLHLMASATLAGEKEELRDFAGRLLSKDASRIHVIEGERVRPHLADPVGPSVPDVTAVAGFSELKQQLVQLKAEKDRTAFTPELLESPELAARWRERLTSIANPAAIPLEERCPARLLYRALQRASIVHQLVEILRNHTSLPLPELTAQLWQRRDILAQRATIELLRICASARQNVDDLPLIPHRIHVLIRASEGLAICLNPDCSGPGERKRTPLGCVVALDGERCPHCGSIVFTLARCRRCGEAFLLAREERGCVRAVLEKDQTPIKTYALPGGNAPAVNGRVVIDPNTGERRGYGEQGVELAEIASCPTCGLKLASEGDKPQLLIPSLRLLQSIIAETAVSDLPVIGTADRWIRPASGRRLLVFNDSRQRAAQLGIGLQIQHEVQIVRAALARWSAGDTDAEQEINQSQTKIRDLQQTLDAPALPESVRDLLTQQLGDEKRRLKLRQVGLPIDRLVDQPSLQQAVEQILDPELAGYHQASRWSQKEWEENARAVQKRLPVLIARELAVRPRYRLNAETLGFFEIVYPDLNDLEMPPRLSGLLGKQTREALQPLWPDILAALLDTVRMDVCITLGDTKADEEYSEGRVSLGHWLSKKDFVGREQSGTATNDEPRRSRRRRFISAVFRKAEVDSADCEGLVTSLLEEAFEQLRTQASTSSEAFSWLAVEDRQEIYGGGAVKMFQIRFQKLRVRKPEQFFRCTITGALWPRSVLGYAPDLSAPSLELIAEAELDTDPRLGRQRREYREDPVFQTALWADEHSAQLSPQEARRRQELFQGGVRNVLSATTTLELGIDIGGLSGIFLANVPPGSTNYAQRAGRAGRRADGSSLVATFVRSRPFDREVFLRFGDYLAQPRPRPTVALERKRLSQRHLHAFLLGEFSRQITEPGSWRGAMNAFGRMGSFCNCRQLPRWNSGAKPLYQPEIGCQLAPEGPPLWWDKEAPSSRGLVPQLVAFLEWCKRSPEIKGTMETLLKGTPLAGTSFEELLNEAKRQFDAAFANWHQEMDEIIEAWNQASATREANFFSYQSELRTDVTLIEWLSDAQVLPRYGFPIDVHSLKVRTDQEALGRAEKKQRTGSRFEDAFRLERPHQLALQEYVPGSRLLVGGKLVTSHGLIRHWTGENLDRAFGTAGRVATCASHHTYIWEGVAERQRCPFCQEEPIAHPQNVLFPQHGYQTAAWDPPRRSADVESIGSTSSFSITYAPAPQKPGGEPQHLQQDFGGVARLTADYRPDGEIIFTNRGENGYGFAICTACGFAVSETGGDINKLPRAFENHTPLYDPHPNHRCKSRSTPLRFQILAAKVVTDTLLLDFSGLQGDMSPDALRALGYALQRSGARLLELDTRELGVIAGVSSERGGSGVLLYDTAPGGAGHVYELMLLGREWLERAKDVLFISEEHHQRCEHGCLDCLLGFDISEDRSVALDRREAWEILNALLEGQPAHLPGVQDEPAASDRSPAGQRSATERFNLARQRLAQRSHPPT